MKRAPSTKEEHTYCFIPLGAEQVISNQSLKDEIHRPAGHHRMLVLGAVYRSWFEGSFWCFFTYESESTVTTPFFSAGMVSPIRNVSLS